MYALMVETNQSICNKIYTHTHTHIYIYKYMCYKQSLLSVKESQNCKFVIKINKLVTKRTQNCKFMIFMLSKLYTHVY